MLPSQIEEVGIGDLYGDETDLLIQHKQRTEVTLHVAAFKALPQVPQQ